MLFLFYYELDPLFLKMLYLGMYKPSIFLLTKIEHLPKNTADLYMYALYLQNKSLEISIAQAQCRYLKNVVF